VIAHDADELAALVDDREVPDRVPSSVAVTTIVNGLRVM
jgi:hypothetical protein